MKKFTILAILLLLNFSLFANEKKFNYITSLIDDGLYESALSLTKAHPMLTDEEVYQAWFITIKLYCALGDAKKAEAYLQSALEHVDKKSVYFNLAKSHIDLVRGRVSLAKTYIESISKQVNVSDVYYDEFLILRAKTELALGDFEKAIRIIENVEESERRLLEVSRMQINQGSFEDATKTLKEVLSKYPESGRAHLFLGQINELFDDDKSATEYYKKAGSIFFEQDDDARGKQADKLLEALYFGEKNFDLSALKIERKKTVKPKPVEKEKKLPEPPVAKNTTVNEPKTIKPITASPPKTIARPFPFISGQKLVTGSGFVVDGGKRVVTNFHVVASGENFYVRNSLGEMSSVEIDKISRLNDLAVLKLKRPFKNSSSIQNDQFAKARAGANIAVIGFPLASILGSVTPSITNGIVTKTTGFNDSTNSFQLSAKMNKGNSGGAVFDTKGRIIGVATSKLDLVKIMQGDGYLPEDVNFAIHVEKLRELGLIIQEDQSLTKPVIGLDELYQNFIGSVVMVAGERR